ERHYAPYHVAQWYVGGDVLDDEDVEADRRMDQAHFHDDGHDHAEPHQVKAGRFERRQYNWRGHQDDRHRRQEEAQHHDHHKDRRQQDPARQVLRHDPAGDRLADVQVAHHVAVEQRHADDQHQHARFADRVGHDR